MNRHSLNSAFLQHPTREMRKKGNCNLPVIEVKGGKNGGLHRISAIHRATPECTHHNKKTLTIHSMRYRFFAISSICQTFVL